MKFCSLESRGVDGFPLAEGEGMDEQDWSSGICWQTKSHNEIWRGRWGCCWAFTFFGALRDGERKPESQVWLQGCRLMLQ